MEVVIYIIQLLIISYIGTATSGVSNSKVLIRDGAVYMTQEQKEYFSVDASGYTKKDANSWTFLTVCSSKQQGLNYAGVPTDFRYILCPLNPFGFGGTDRYCCGDKDRQRCCGIDEYISGKDTATAGSVTSKGGLPNSAELIRNGQVHMTEKQKQYFLATGTGYSKKDRNSWTFLTVCSSNKSGLNYAGVPTDFQYILCPTDPNLFGTTDSDCCGVQGEQRCCYDMYDEDERNWKLFKNMATGVMVAVILIPLLCIASCIAVAVGIFVKCNRRRSCRQAAGFRAVAADPPNTQPSYPPPAYQQQPQQAYPQQAYPQQAYPQQAYPQQAYPQQANPEEK